MILSLSLTLVVFDFGTLLFNLVHSLTSLLLRPAARHNDTKGMGGQNKGGMAGAVGGDVGIHFQVIQLEYIDQTFSVHDCIGPF